MFMVWLFYKMYWWLDKTEYKNKISIICTHKSHTRIFKALNILWDFRLYPHVSSTSCKTMLHLQLPVPACASWWPSLCLPATGRDAGGRHTGVWYSWLKQSYYEKREVLPSVKGLWRQTMQSKRRPARFFIKKRKKWYFLFLREVTET